MNYKKIEELFIDFILDIIGPNEEIENERNNNLKIIQDIILNILTQKLPDYKTHVLTYGSFPIKTYLKDADIDITIFFESKIEKKVLTDIPIQLIDKTILIIRDELERQNRESLFELISDIKVINGGIRLLKCRIGSINIDISINNFAGLFKIIFIDFIENQLKFQFNKKNLFNDRGYDEYKINIFRRTLLLIKGWCFYEGKLMGSNIGLMASYTLEILVIFLFNLHYDVIQNEYDGFEKFFELMNKINWKNNIITLYGIMPKFNFYSKLQNLNNSEQKEKENKENKENKDNKELNININMPFWFLDNNNNNNDIITFSNKDIEPLLNINEVKTFIQSLNKGIGNIYLLKEGNVINGANFDKYINVLDPLNNHNNLGKSINYHSYKKMKKVILYINKKLKNIQDIRKKYNPFLYINALLNLFKETLSKIDVELFSNSLNNPEFISNSKIYKKFHKYDKNNNVNIYYNIDKSEIEKFNNLFTDNPRNDDSTIFEEEDLDNYEEDDEDIEESDSDKSEIEEDEDKDKYEEEEDEVKKEKNEIIDEDIEENEQYLEIKENIYFEQLLTKGIIKNLFEEKEKRTEIVKYNNQLLEKSKQYTNNLEKLLKLHKLI